MKKKLKRILLVDDDEATNFIHKIAIEDAGCCEEVICVSNGLEAISFLTKPENGSYPCPEFIFLDLNMPLMDGWEFLDVLQKLLGRSKMPEIYILSAFGKAKDRELAQQHPHVLGYIDKPLTRNRIEEIFDAKMH